MSLPIGKMESRVPVPKKIFKRIFELKLEADCQHISKRNRSLVFFKLTILIIKVLFFFKFSIFFQFSIFFPFKKKKLTSILNLSGSILRFCPSNSGFVPQVVEYVSVRGILF
eukprot:Lithocolla_globosa_v1_NODE_1405_length_2604_cov_72.908984.p3 type:complete len:112 gc:universal NODE_1405_length_2604_cov_72.908984:2231-2566(+)